MIIAIAGKNGVGKDTVAKILKDKIHRLCALEFDIKKFSYLPSHLFKEITDMDYLKLPRNTKEVMRDYFVQFCESCKDIFGQNIWVYNLMKDYNPEKDNWIISDLRFPNEIDYLKKEKTLTIYVSYDGERIPEESLQGNFTVIYRESDLFTLENKIVNLIEDTIKEWTNL